MKEHLTGAEVCPCVAGGKGEGLSAKCQCLSCEARLIKEGLVSDWWPHWTSRIWWGNLMHQNRSETRMRHIDNIYTNTPTHTHLHACAHVYKNTHIFTNSFMHTRWQVSLLSLWMKEKMSLKKRVCPFFATYCRLLFSSYESFICSTVY